MQRGASSDQYENYLSKGEAIDLEVTLTAKRRQNLGKLSFLLSKLPSNKTGIIEFDGQEYDAVTADVSFGGKLRKVGVFGSSRDAGVIDLTKSIEKGLDGHPTFASMKNETKSLLATFHNALRS